VTQGHFSLDTPTWMGTFRVNCIQCLLPVKRWQSCVSDSCRQTVQCAFSVSAVTQNQMF